MGYFSAARQGVSDNETMYGDQKHFVSKGEGHKEKESRMSSPLAGTPGKFAKQRPLGKVTRKRRY